MKSGTGAIEYRVELGGDDKILQSYIGYAASLYCLWILMNYEILTELPQVAVRPFETMAHHPGQHEGRGWVSSGCVYALIHSEPTLAVVVGFVAA